MGRVCEGVVVDEGGDGDRVGEESPLAVGDVSPLVLVVFSPKVGWNPLSIADVSDSLG